MAADTVQQLQHPDFSPRVYIDASEHLQEFIGPIAVRDLPGRTLVISRVEVQGGLYDALPYCSKCFTSLIITREPE